MMNHKPSFDHASYMSIAMRPDILLKHRAKITKYLNQFEFDAIAFRGNSGALLAAPLAMVLKKTLMLVRKEGVNSHSAQKVEGDKACKRYLIVDDFSSTGATVRAIYDAVTIFAPQAKCAGLFAVKYCFNDWTNEWKGINEIDDVDLPGKCELVRKENV